MGFQHLFHRRSTAKNTEEADVTETFKLLMEARFDRLESNFQLLRNEWADTHEKLMLLYDRTRKRVKASEKAQEQPEVENDVIAPIDRESILRTYRQQNGEQ